MYKNSRELRVGLMVIGDWLFGTWTLELKPLEPGL